MIKLLCAILTAIPLCSNACVTLDSNTSTYTVDTSGCVEFQKEEMANDELAPIQFKRD